MCSWGRLEAGFGHNQPGTALGFSTSCSAAVIPSSEEAVFLTGSPGFCLPAALASEGSWGLVPVGGWTRTPGRAGEDTRTPDGLETPLGPTAAVPALREALESSCCQLGGGTACDPCSGLARSLISHSRCPRCPNTPPTSRGRTRCPLLWETSLEAEQESGHHQVEPSPSPANPTGLAQPARRKHKPALPLQLLPRSWGGGSRSQESKRCLVPPA